MSRVAKYRECISKFITTSTTLPIYGKGENIVTHNGLKNFIQDMIDDSDNFLSIFLLTVVNNQNKKNKVNVNSYCAASIVEYLSFLQRLRHKRQIYQEKYGDCVNDLIPYKVTTCVMDLLYSNLEVTKRYVKNQEKFQKIAEKAIQLVSNEAPEINGDILLEYKSPKITDNLYRFYLNQRMELQSKYLTLKLIKQESLIQYFKDTICRLFKLAVSLGWLLTASDDDTLSRVQEVGILFAIFYQIGLDFSTVDDDLIYASEHNKITYNYVINCGLQKSYEDFMNYKQRLITILIETDLYTRTVREMIESVDEWMNGFVAVSNPNTDSSIYYSHGPS
jgi:hypothetical protein